MSKMSPGIILAGANPNIADSFHRGQRARAEQQEFQRRNALADFYQENGADVLAGNQNALNGLAQHDPQAALNIQNSYQANARADASAGRAAETHQMTVDEYRRGLSADQAAADAAEIEESLTQANMYYQKGDLQGMNSFLESKGLAPLDRLEDYPAAAAPFEDLFKSLQDLRDFNAPPAPLSSAGKTQADINNGLLPEGTPLPKGGVHLSFGEGAFGTKATNDIETRVVNAGAMLGRLSDTQALFKPEYLEFGTRLSNTWTGLKDKIGSASPDEQAQLGEFTRFKTEAFNNLNTTLKELSGAAVTPQEAERLNEQLPNAGTGVWDGDSPTEFQAKMEQSIKQQKLAIARYNIWLAQGRNGKPWELGELNDVPTLINQRGEQIAEQLRASGITDPDTLKQQVAVQLRKEVGF
ncbi:hypothetical protein ROA7450_03373 [Roseovarius albus]|uniref:Uncharacterized protein n=1 Tax=Roseovarius albus TaxID=1247867 RepID=A0A1X6ZWQ8_9RHOB|nr:hypothetical protein [Roseovarius albus]SLN64040.1 hypothetical protein ROA7450_03373 [Roseovarius albus]